MLIAYWITAGLLALAFLGAGLMKATRPKEALASSGMAYVEDFSDTQIKLIGVAEVLGAIGVVLPKLLGIAPALSLIAAACLAITMVGAVVVHSRRKEASTPAVVLGVLALAVLVLGILA